MPYLSSQHIKLRTLESTDLELLYDIENNEEFWSYSNTIQPFSKDTLKNYLNHSHEDLFSAKQLRLVIDNKNKTSIGLVDLFEFDPFHKRIGIGIVIKKNYQNLGYATKCLRLIKQYCFKHLDLHQIFAHIATDNQKSLDLFHRQNFTITGTYKDWLRNQDLYKDVYFLQCFKP